MLSEVMIKTAVPPGLEAGFTQPIMTTLTQLSENSDMQVVQFIDEQEGGGEPQATAVQQSHEETPYQAKKPNKLRSQDFVSHTWQEGWDRVRKSAAKLKSVVKKPDPPAAFTVSPAM